MPVNDPHDKYFRSVMQIHQVAIEFLQWFLPKHISEILDLDSLTLIEGTFIDEDLNKTMSDVVFDCQYRLNNDASGIVHHSKIIILIEHQSSPERFMPIRVFNYLFSLLNKHLKAEEFNNSNDNRLLPAVYPIVFYHGKSRAPISLEWMQQNV